jgi:hypothetical protein
MPDGTPMADGRPWQKSNPVTIRIRKLGLNGKNGHVKRNHINSSPGFRENLS